MPILLDLNYNLEENQQTITKLHYSIDVSVVKRLVTLNATYLQPCFTVQYKKTLFVHAF